MEKGRKIKRKYARVTTLKIRISQEHLDLLNAIIKEDKAYSTIISQADVIERAIERLGGERFLSVGNL